MATRLENNLLKLVSEGQHVGADEVTALFDRLPPVSVQELLGDWQGLAIQTGHKDVETLDSIGWVGKTFHSADEVDPVIVLSPDGKRVAKGEWGSARIYEVRFRGIVSAAMVYDQLPIIDHFRRLEDNILIGVMDKKGACEDFGMAFILRRI